MNNNRLSIASSTSFLVFHTLLTTFKVIFLISIYTYIFYYVYIHNIINGKITKILIIKGAEFSENKGFFTYNKLAKCNTQ